MNAIKSMFKIKKETSVKKYYIESKQHKILNEINEILSIDDQIQSSTQHKIFKSMSKAINSRVRTIEKICSNPKYSIHFVGAVGSGKTTLISLILNLISKQEEGSESKKIKDFYMLPVDSGRTTLCEMEIFPNEENVKILIEALEEKEFDEKLGYFVDDFLNIRIDDKVDNSNDTKSEEKRAIQNMARLTTDDEKNYEEFKKQIHRLENKKLDEIRKESYDSKIEYKNLIVELLRGRINYNDRKEIQFDYNEEIDFKDWFKKIIIDINYGKCALAPYPQKIKIFINAKKYLDAQIPYYIKSIVDSRGLDGGQRSDVLENIKEGNNIIIFCGSVEQYGNDDKINDILKYAFPSGERDYHKRAILLGLKGVDQLENSKKEEKIQDVKRIFRTKHIEFDEEHFNFFNSMEGIWTHKNSIEKIDTCEVECNVENFWSIIDELIASLYDEGNPDSYTNQVNNSNRRISSFKNSKLDDFLKERIKECYDYTYKLKQGFMNKDIEEPLDILIKRSLYNTHPKALQCAIHNNGRGISFDLFYDVLYRSAEFYDNRLSADLLTSKAKLIEMVENIFKKDNKEDIFNACESTILEEIERIFKMNRDNKTKQNYEYSIKELKPVLPPWDENNFTGSGCRDRMASKIYMIFEKYPQIKTNLNSKKHEEKFFHDLLLFLEVN